MTADSNRAGAPPSAPGRRRVAVPRRVLPCLVLGQLLGTAPWFAANVASPDPAGFDGSAAATLTAAVQGGFVIGTLGFAAAAIADRFSACRVFLVCSALAAMCNGGLLLPGATGWVLPLRFLVGIALAGVYPVGMKIALSWYPQGLGRALGFLVAALVLGTATPHLLRALGRDWPWQHIIATTSLAALGGGLTVQLLVGDGPNHTAAAHWRPRALLAAFRRPELRAATCGYFGHMWELYTFWALVPPWLVASLQGRGASSLPLAWCSFWIIGSGALGCIAGGWWSNRWSSQRIALGQLTVSGLFCLLSPLIFELPASSVVAALLLWGVVVVGDSPQFSALNAVHAPAHLAGSVLTLVNGIGFGISMVSLLCITWIGRWVPMQWIFWLLVPGPLLGVVLYPTLRREKGMAAVVRR